MDLVYMLITVVSRVRQKSILWVLVNIVMNLQLSRGGGGRSQNSVRRVHTVNVCKGVDLHSFLHVALHGGQ